MGESMKAGLKKMHGRIRDKLLEKLFYSPRKQVAFTYDLAPLGPHLMWLYVPEKGIYLGRDDYDREVYLNPAQLRVFHGVIIGPSGAGKSLFLKHFLYQIPNLKVNFMIIDPHSDYSVLIRKLGGEVIDIRKTMFKTTNIFRNIESRELFIKAVAALYRLTEGQELSLREAIKRSKDFSQVLSNLPPVLRSKLEYPFSFLTNGEVDLKDLLDEKIPFSVDLSSMRRERPVLDEAASVIARLAIDEVLGYYWKKPRMHRLRFLIVADEYHNILAKPIDVVERILRETRKIGVYMVVASQDVDKFSESYFTQVGFIIALTLSEGQVEELRALTKKNITDADELFITTAPPMEEFFPTKALLLVHYHKKAIRVRLDISEEVLEY